MRAGVLGIVMLAVAATPALAQSASPKTAAKKQRESARANAEHLNLLTRVSPLELLNYDSVRKELELTPAQEERRRECEARLNRFREETGKKLQELQAEADPEAIGVLRQQRVAALRAMEPELTLAMLKALDARQRTRLDQIGIQQEGYTAFFRPEVQERLNMSPGQIELVQQIVAEGREDVNRARAIEKEAFGKATVTPDPDRPNVLKIDPKDVPAVTAARLKSEKAVVQARELAELRILKLLSKKQRQVYQGLRGERFDLATLKRFATQPQEKGAAKAQSR